VKIKIKTSELTGSALDWAVAKCNGDKVGICLGGYLAYRESIKFHPYSAKGYSPSTDWAQGGPIIEREKISTVLAHFHWCAGTGDIGEIYRSDEGNHFTGTGPTPLIAAMRCYVASKLGDEVDVPDELINNTKD